MQGPEYDAFTAAAKAEIDSEFVQITDAEVAQEFAEDSIRPPFIAVRKQEPERFTAFGMVLAFALGYISILGYIGTCRTKNRTFVVFTAHSSIAAVDTKPK